MCFPPAFLFTCLYLSWLEVKHLEDENKKLDTKLKILKEHEEYGGKIDDIIKQLQNEMEEQIENLIQDQEKLQAELLKKQKEVEDTKNRSVGLVGVVLLLFYPFSGLKTIILPLYISAMRMNYKRKLSWKMSLFLSKRYWSSVVFPVRCCIL